MYTVSDDITDTLEQWWIGKYLTNISAGGSKPWFVALLDLHGINFKVDFKLSCDVHDLGVGMRHAEYIIIYFHHTARISVNSFKLTGHCKVQNYKVMMGFSIDYIYFI